MPARARADGHPGRPHPQPNVDHLMLDERVIDAVRARRFRVWPVDTVDQAMELLTGRTAGERDRSACTPCGA